ncbi:aldo/keto reductase [Candidatus Sumerlaeota bacterium]|nr:aldo/keto reductase [Candidatus Sumerlaeota bacterium]
MIYRTLGRTGLRVSIVGYGASPLGEEFGSIDPDEGRRAVDRAIDLGINFFDVSPYYGRTLAETRLGEFLDGKRDQVVLATKTGRYDSRLPEGFDFSAKRVKTSIDESLKRLRTDHVDLLQAHDIEFGDLDQIVAETIPAMLDLKKEGKVRFVGITGYPLRALRKVASRADIDTILSYCRYNLMDTAMDEILTPLAREKEIALVNASPLHMRVLSEKGAPDWHPAPSRVCEAGIRAAELCRKRGVDISDLAMQFALDYEPVATTLVGMSKVRHVESNVRMVGRKPDPELLKEVLDVFAPVANVCWRSGRPENDDPDAVECDP